MKNTFTRLTAYASFLLALMLSSALAVKAQTVVLNPTSPWTVPAGVTQIKVECWGGGGAGGGINSTTTSGGSGGGGGAYTTGVLSVTAGQAYTVVIGTGGVGAVDANGGNGTASSVSGTGGTVTGNFGIGGGRRAGTAGAGGTGTFNGGAGGLSSGQGAGGGGGAGNAGAGTAGSNGAAGVGGIGNPNAAPYVGGAGASIRNGTSGNTGLPGVAPGGGGGGGYTFLFNGTKAGGNGGAGQVIITYCQTYSLSSISAVTPRCVTTATSTITLNGNLPVGSYTVTYNRSLPAATGLTATMTVTTANTGTIVATGLTTVGTSTITVTNIASTTSTFCTNAVSANNVTSVVVSGAATVVAGADQSLCSNTTAALSGSFGGTATAATWSSAGGGTFSPNATTVNAVFTPSASEVSAGTAALTLTTNNPAGACPAVSDGLVLTLRTVPTAVSATPVTSTICIGSAVTLNGVATISSTAGIASDNFNGTVSYAAAGTNSGGGTIFSQQSSGYSVNLTAINNTDGSKYMIATTAAGFGNASTTSTLTSPVFNTTAYSTLNFSFRHFYTKGSEAGVSVQVSTNSGTSWSNVSTAGTIIATNTYTATTGASGNFAIANFNFTPFVNTAGFRIRFNFVSNVGILGSSWWAIDDPALNGIPLPLFSWTASTGTGVNGLPAGAGTSSLSNKTISVNPALTTTYTLTASDIVTGCGSSTATSVVNVNQNSTIALSSAAGTSAQTICMPGAITDITYAIGGGGTGASITSGSLPNGLTASYNAGIFTISGTPTQFGNYSYTITTAGPCINTSLSGTISVNTAPTLICPANAIVNTDPGVCSSTQSYTATATGFPAPAVSYLVNGDFISFPYEFPLGVTNVDVLAEGACSPDANCSFTVTVQDLEAPTADLGTLPVVTGECSATVTDFPTATDACDGAIIGTTTDPLTYTVQGSYTITWTYTDLKGNSSTQTQTITVNDVTPPVITCPATQAFCATLANTFTIPALVATDNCVVTSVSYQVTGATSRSGTGNNASGLFNAGISTIVWTVVDGNNNISTCSTTVNINEIPLIPTVAGVVNVCPYLGTGAQLEYTASSIGATTYTWTPPVNSTVITGAGTAVLTLSFNNAFAANGNKQLRVKASNACGVSPTAIYYLLTQYPSTPNPISGPTNVCTLIGSAATATYVIPPAMSAVAYLWNGPAGTTITHPNGAGINDTIINVSYSNSFAGGAITVYGVDSCGTSGARSLNIARTASSVPGLITGSTNVCSNILPGGTAAVYTIRALNGATSYNWSAPAGSVTTHPNGPGINDTMFTVQYPAGFTNGSVTVSSANGCGTSNLRSLPVNKLNPATPSVIDVIQTGFCEDAGGRAYTYTLSSMPANANSVQWTVPTASGAVISSGQGTTSISVLYPATSVQGTVTAQSINNCGSSTIRSTPANLPACPPPGFTRSGNAGQVNKSVQATPLAEHKLEVKLSPNPTVSDFALQVLTAAKEKIDVRILDMQGREFKRLTVMPYQTINLGAELKAGSYFVEIVQGENRTTQKLVKF